jgi:hypothetical protein
MQTLVRGTFRWRSLLAAAAMLLTACGAMGGAGSPGRPMPAGSARPTGESPKATPVAGQSTPPGPPLRTPPTIDSRTLVVRDQDNGHAVSVRVGERVSLVLARTNWQVEGRSDQAVLRQLAPAAVSSQPGGCVPGAGCGVVSALFDAVAAGRADVTAKRTSCGEALSCTGNLGLYRVTIAVLG